MPGGIVTGASTLMCAHGGQVQPRPGQMKVTMGGGAALCEPDLIGAPIVGCTQPATSNTKPCTTVVKVNEGSTSPKVAICGRPAYLDTLTAITDGVPPGVVTALPLPGAVMAP